MAIITFDINTSDETIDGTPAGQIYRPMRYTTTERDGIRVALWTQLATVLGSYRFDTTQGLDVEALLDPVTSDAERSALVAEIIEAFPGVVAITAGPTVTVVDGTLAQITVTADTTDGPISLVL